MRIVVRLVLWTWFLAALTAGKLGLLLHVPVPAMQGLLLALTGLLLAAYFGIGSIRTWVDALDLRVLVLLHLTRFVGLYFLVLYHRGELPYAFAVPAGWSGMSVAFLALAVVLAPLREEIRRHACFIWNTIGLVALLLILVTTMRVGLARPWQLSPLQLLPLSLLPTFLTPFIIATHVIIYVRLLRSPPETAHPE
ncbi:MAG: hypothetical protein PHE83_00805 [Opitutaceae bacterium]|nr:hypothetical protein [Opitutaceae bacterium]